MPVDKYDPTLQQLAGLPKSTWLSIQTSLDAHFKTHSSVYSLPWDVWLIFEPRIPDHAEWVELRKAVTHERGRRLKALEYETKRKPRRVAQKRALTHKLKRRLYMREYRAKLSTKTDATS
jgi:hypothetical protein